MTSFSDTQFPYASFHKWVSRTSSVFKPVLMGPTASSPPVNIAALLAVAGGSAKEAQGLRELGTRDKQMMARLVDLV